MSESSLPNPIFRESLAPPVWLLGFIYFLLASLALSIWAALGDSAGVISILFFTVLLMVIRSKSTLHIEVTHNELTINRAHIEKKFLGEVTQLDSAHMRTTRGRDADPASFLAIRFWVSQGIKIEVKDSKDSTPYWLISTKKGNQLAKALKD